MREILFRGKSPIESPIENGWIEGLLVQVGKYYSVIRRLGKDGKGYYDYIVYPYTVSQFTGLTDKNGKKIFEGDIVEAKQSSFIQRGVVTQLSDGLYVFKGWRYRDLTDFKLKDVNLERCLSVIGNIHDNPELLEVEE